MTSQMLTMMGWSGSRCVFRSCLVASKPTFYDPALGSSSTVAGKYATSSFNHPPVILMMDILAQPPTPSMQQHDPYIPAPNVVGENERFIFALRHAPNVLYTRFKQYGQVSVTAKTE